MSKREIEVRIGPTLDGSYYWEPAKRANHRRGVMGKTLPEGYVPVRFADGGRLLVHQTYIRAALARVEEA
jgi:hypothetical protein